MTNLHNDTHNAVLKESLFLSREAIDHILPIAYRLYEQRGAAGVSFDTLAGASNTEAPRLVKHFKTKARLSQAVMAYCLAQQSAILQALIQTASHSDTDHHPHIVAVLDYCRTLCDTPHPVGWLGHWALQSCQAGTLDDDLRRYYTGHWHTLFSECARIHHPEEAVPMITEHAMALWHGLLFMQAIGDAHHEPLWFVQALRALFIPNRHSPTPTVPTTAANDPRHPPHIPAQQRANNVPSGLYGHKGGP